MPERSMYPALMAEVSDSREGLFPDLVELTVSTTFRKSEVIAGLLDTDGALQATIKAVRRIMAELVEEGSDG